MLPVFITAIDSLEQRQLIEELYLTYKDMLMGIAYKILGDRNTAEDALQQAFLRVIAHAREFETSECHKTRRLLVIMIRSAAIDIYRQRKNSREVYLDDVIEVLDEDDQYEEKLLDSVEIGELMEALRELSIGERDILTLAYVDDLPANTIAKLLGISGAAVRKRLQRAKESLRVSLKERGVTVEPR
ncbi:MAG: sigma-70 family RNA polymerase sigma factor [Oscillospiraceae bacterium]|nr:sigma-70 family RNA polymerase sigma factor [Oscillospiraceae bacterium]